jgi:hypothetical protein
MRHLLVGLHDAIVDERSPADAEANMISVTHRCDAVPEHCRPPNHRHGMPDSSWRKQNAVCNVDVRELACICAGAYDGSMLLA